MTGHHFYCFIFLTLKNMVWLWRRKASYKIQKNLFFEYESFKTFYSYRHIGHHHGNQTPDTSSVCQFMNHHNFFHSWILHWNGTQTCLWDIFTVCDHVRLDLSYYSFRFLLDNMSRSRQLFVKLTKCYNFAFC